MLGRAPTQVEVRLGRASLYLATWLDEIRDDAPLSGRKSTLDALAARLNLWSPILESLTSLKQPGRMRTAAPPGHGHDWSPGIQARL